MIKTNKIYNMDCLEGMRAIRDESIDMILCDLPYGITRCGWDSVIPLEPLWKQYKRIIKPNRAIVLTALQPFTSMLVTSNISQFKYSWVWEKAHTGQLNCKKQPLRSHEDVLVFGNGSVFYLPQFSEGAPYTVKRKNYKGSSCYGGQTDHTTISSGKRYPKSILSIVVHENKFHPTQKPVALFEYLIRTYTNKGDVVLDNCMGSGTTAIACISAQRDFIGFELDEMYWSVANKRINALYQSIQKDERYFSN